MPIISVDIPNTHESVIRPVVLDIIKDIKKLTGIESAAKVYLLGATGKALQPNTALDGVVDGLGDGALSAADMMLQIEVSEEYPEASALTTAVLRRENQPDFLDPNLNITVKPVYSRADITLNIKARFPDRVSAVKWRNEFKRHTAQGRRTNTHTVTYSYAINDEILLILAAIHRLREKHAGYGEDLTTYIGKYLSYAATTLVNQAGENPLLVVSQTKDNVLGRFDILVSPEPAEVDKELGTWETSFTYKFMFEVPTALVMQYPLVVHNSMLSSRWRPSEVPYSLDKDLTTPTLSQWALEPFRNTYPSPKSALPGVSYPFFDDWYPEISHPFYTQLIRIALTANPNDLNEVIDLKDLGDFEIDPLLMSFIQKKPGNIVLTKRSIIKVTLYDGLDPVDETKLIVNPDMTIRTVDPMNMRHNYHLVISLLVDLTQLPADIIDDLRKDGLLALAILAILFPDAQMPDLLSDGSIRKIDFLDLANTAKDYYLDSYQNGGGNIYTVGFYSIIARRR